MCAGMQDTHDALRVLVLDLSGQTSQPTVPGFYETLHNAIGILIVYAVCFGQMVIQLIAAVLENAAVVQQDKMTIGELRNIHVGPPSGCACACPG
jgi:hypothetical protein